MVRLGQENEKYAERVQNIQQSFEARVVQAEQRLAAAEQNGLLFDRKGENNTSIMAELVEKLENKVLAMDQGMQALRTELHSERESLGRLEINNLRNNEDFKNVIG